MFREEHYHITLSNETPPRTFFRICCDLFTGQLFHKMHERSYICLVSQIVIWGRITQWHGDILNRSNSSMFLLRKPFEIGECLISSAPQEFEWSPKGKCQNLLAQILWRRTSDVYTGKIWYSLSEGFARSCFRKKLIWKTSEKIHPKETVINFFFQLPQNLKLHWKRTPSQLFSDEFWKGFSECSFMSEHWQSNRGNWSIRPHMF